ncbi:subtilisin-like protease SBT1.6 [Sesbania bispinosa]|nr:subtilisin-like protease SBT1.6 [Sesbania bispinosa]
MIDEATGMFSTPYDFGAGHLNLGQAMDPGHYLYAGELSDEEAGAGESELPIICGYVPGDVEGDNVKDIYKDGELK